MDGSPRQIVAFGGGGFSMEKDNTLLDDYVGGLVDCERPRVCFLPTASGDADHYIVRFYRAFDATRFEPSHVSLFRRDGGAADVHEHIVSSDIVYVGGGSVVSALGAWRAHGLDQTLRLAWERGVVMCGASAGSLCWFRSALSAFHGPAQLVEGLGLLPYSNCVHFDCERDREGAFRQHLVDGMCAGFAAEDGAALHFVGERLRAVVTSRPDARAFRMRRTEAGRVERRALPTCYLGAADAPASAGGALVRIAA
ncbi:MAG: Type 1 glutamine amidotransferase-like domain-containing protein [Thermoleophilaceae bacterium]